MTRLFENFAALTFAVCRIAPLKGAFAVGISAANFNELFIYLAGGILGLVLLGVIISIGLVLIVYLIFSLIFGGKRRRRKREEKEMLEKAAEAERKAKQEAWEARKKRNKEEGKPAEELALAPELAANPAPPPASKPLDAKPMPPAAEQPQSIAPPVTPTWTAAEPVRAAVPAASTRPAPQAVAAPPKPAPVKPPQSQNPDVFYIPLVTEAVPDLPVLDVPSITETEIEENTVAEEPAKSTETPVTEHAEELSGGIVVGEAQPQPALEEKAEETAYKKEEEQPALTANTDILTGLVPEGVDLDKILNEPIAEHREEGEEAPLQVDADLPPDAEATEERAGEAEEKTAETAESKEKEEAEPLSEHGEGEAAAVTEITAAAQPEPAASSDLPNGEISAQEAEVIKAAPDLAAPPAVKEKAKKPAASKVKAEGTSGAKPEKKAPAKEKTEEKPKTATAPKAKTTAPKAKAAKPKEEAVPAAVSPTEEAAVNAEPAAVMPEPEKPEAVSQPNKAAEAPAPSKERIGDELYVSEMKKLPKAKPQNKVTSIEEALAMLAGTPPPENKK